MPNFQYKAYNTQGKLILGQVEAPSNGEALKKLEKEGLYPKELTSREEGVRSGSYSLFGHRVSLTELATTTRQLSTLLTSGADLHEALTILVNEEENKRLRSALIRVKEQITEGCTLAKALECDAKIFTELYRRMVEAGEESGTLAETLERLADYFKSKSMIREQVRTALMYPALMSAVGFGVLSFLFIFVIPKITRIFEDTQSALPLITVVLLWIVDLFKNYWFVLLLAIAGAWWWTIRFIKKPRGKAIKDDLILKLPWIGGVFKKFYTASFARTLGSLLERGIPILKALDMTKRVLNHTGFDRALDKAVKDITEGGTLSESLRNATVVSGLLVHMISIGERSGNLGRQLLIAAEAQEKEFEYSVTRALTLLEPLMILTMGVVVGFIVLAILLPIFQLNQIVG